MAAESLSERGEHIRSVSITAVSAMLGVAAALISAAITEGLEADAAATDPQTYALVLAAIAIQFPLLKYSGLYTEDELGPKLYLFVTFMTFSLWFVTWGIILTVEFAG